MRTYTDLATMEAANEAARRATNAILALSGVDAPPCVLWEFDIPKPSSTCQINRCRTQAQDRTAPQLGLGNIASPVQEASTEASEWQTEDFLAAEPYPLPEVTDKMIEQYLQNQLDSASQVGSSTPGGAPGSGDDQEQDRPTAGFSYPPPFNQHEVLTPYHGLPVLHRRQGVFQAERGELGRLGSIHRQQRDFTAGHVVHAGNNQAGGWSTNMVFVPAYKDGEAPFGQFTVRQLFTRTAWYQNGNPGGLYEDMGAAI